MSTHWNNRIIARDHNQIFKQLGWVEGNNGKGKFFFFFQESMALRKTGNQWTRKNVILYSRWKKKKKLFNFQTTEIYRKLFFSDACFFFPLIIFFLLNYFSEQLFNKTLALSLMIRGSDTKPNSISKFSQKLFSIEWEPFSEFDPTEFRVTQNFPNCFSNLVNVRNWFQSKLICRYKNFQYSWAKLFA